jgi:folate-binding protein YgfZ
MVKILRIPTYAWHQQRGATFEDYFGCEIPAQYGDFQQEYWLIRKRAVIRDVSFFGKIKVTGRDRQRFLNGMLTNEVKALDAGKGTFALFLDVKGHIQADMKVYVFPDHLLLVLQHYLVEKLMSGLDRYIMSEDVRMQDITGDLSMIQVLGPESAGFLNSRGITSLPEDNYSHNTISVASTEANLIRLPVGYAILSEAGSGGSILEQLSGPMAGSKAFDVFRIESGIPLMHRDMDESNFPQEVGLNGAINFQKGCYLGQETMARIDAQGHVNKHLVGIASSAVIQAGDKIFKDQKEVGKITSSTRSLLLNQAFGLGFIRREFATEGERVQVGSHNASATIRDLPLKD